MIPKTLKVKTLFPMVNGLFHYMNYSFPSVLTLTPEQLDMIWCTNYGMRMVAPVVLVVHEDSSQSVLSSEELSRLGQMILVMYKYKWDRLAHLLSLEYDPIHNYSDDVHEEITEDIDRNETLTHGTTIQTATSKSGTDTITDSGSERVVTSGTKSDTRTDNLQEQFTGNTENGIYGFNSADAVGDSTTDSQNTRTNTGTQVNSGQSSNESTTYGGLVHSTQKADTINETQGTTGSDTTEGGSNRTRVRDLTHLGNIGNLTTQQLMTQEIELWRWNFIQEVLNDVKDFLTIPIYD